MRATASSLTWALAAISGTAYAAEPSSEEHLSAPYVVPAQFNWLQGIADRFANYIDVLSLQFSGVLGGWSRQPVLFAITPADAKTGRETSAAKELVMAPGADITQCADANYEIIPPPQNAANPPLSPGEGH